MNRSLFNFWLNAHNYNLLIWVPIIISPFLIALFIYFLIKEKDKKEKIRPVVGLIAVLLLTGMFLFIFCRTPSQHDKKVLIARFKGTDIKSSLESIEFSPPFDNDYNFIGNKEKIIVDNGITQKITIALQSIEYTSEKAPITYNQFRMVFIYNDGKRYKFYCVFSKDAGTILEGDFGEFRCNALEKVLTDSGILNYMKGWYQFSNESKKTAIYKKVVLKRGKQP